MVFVAAVMGGVVASLFDYRGPWQTVRKIGVGALSSLYVTPVVKGWLPGLSGDAGQGFAGYVVGLCGLLIVETIIEFIKARRALIKGGGHEADG